MYVYMYMCIHVHTHTQLMHIFSCTHKLFADTLIISKSAANVHAYMYICFTYTHTYVSRSF